VHAKLARPLQYRDCRDRSVHRNEETAMFATQQNRNTAQRAVCMLLAAFIVSTGLATGALGMHVAERNATAAVVKHVA
jgi:hypothetical protein